MLIKTFAIMNFLEFCSTTVEDFLRQNTRENSEINSEQSFAFHACSTAATREHTRLLLETCSSLNYAH
jgi:hypothetical protein